MSVYADTSFLVSLYVLDSNSERAANQVQRAILPVLMTPLRELELTNAISLRLFRKELIPSRLKAARALVQKDIGDGILLIKPLTVGVFQKAIRMARRRSPRLGTRTLDMLHVASALELNAEMFYTFDRNQERLAKAEGLLTA